MPPLSSSQLAYFGALKLVFIFTNSVIFIKNIWGVFSNLKPGRSIQYGEDEVESQVFWVDVILGQTFIIACLVSLDFESCVGL